MFLAKDETGDRTLPYPGGSAVCPICNSEVISKCGTNVAWHWAHRSVKLCDTWAEPEGDWHFGWKQLAGLDNCEITIEKDGKRHRADIIIDGLVIELQHSPIPVTDVLEREEFYGKMIWIVDGDNGLLEKSPDPVERWVSRNNTLYYKWVGKVRSWIYPIPDEIKWIHFSTLPISTYRWDSNRLGKYHPVTDTRHPCLVMQDSMVNIRGKFCRILPKNEFIKQYLAPKM